MKYPTVVGELCIEIVEHRPSISKVIEWRVLES